jgi:ABC-type dipeptide/oligopeptide/nickel transport system permease subunit
MSKVAIKDLPQRPAAVRQFATPRTLWGDAWRRFVRNRLAIIGLILVIGILILGLGAPLIAPAGYNDQVLAEAFHFPSAAHPLGTDYLGRDMLARIAYGTRTSLIVVLFVQLLSLVIGVPLGAVAGLRGGKIDWLITRIIDIFSALPWYLLAIYLISVIQPGLGNIIIALALSSWVMPCRLVRAQFLAMRERDFVTAAMALGAGQEHIVRRHLLPNALTPVVIAVALGIPAVIFGEAGLSFLGLGITPPEPSLGQMVQEGLAHIMFYGYMVLVPAAMIAVIVLGFTLMGDGLRDALDPQMLGR